MPKLLFAALLLTSCRLNASETARFDFNTGLLTLPVVNTPYGIFSAQLQANPNLVNTASLNFKIVQVYPIANLAFQSNTALYNNLQTGLLRLPIINTSQGTYSAVLESLSTSDKNNQPTSFNLISVSPYIAPKANKIQECVIFPTDNVWNTPINSLPIHNRSKDWIKSIGASSSIWMDFGAGNYNGGSIGIPYNKVIGSKTPKSSIQFVYHDESDLGPYPIGEDPSIEFGHDHHLLTLDIETCYLYEIHHAAKGIRWQADSGAIWDLRSNRLRTEGWTSADAAGLPIFPGLIHYEEVAAGFIGHAIRFTVPKSNSYVWPARHLTDGMVNALSEAPPLGARFRLKSSFPINTFPAELQVILKAMQTYGIINADNGSPWFISGVPDDRWDNDLLQLFRKLHGNDFEAVDTSCLIVDKNSAQADLSRCPSFQ